MSISLCLPTYNRLPHLKNCLSSIFEGFEKEEYPYEVIIADGGSTDGTLEYLRNLDNIKLIEQDKLTGTVKAFNTCFKIAKGDYLIPISDDFILFPKVLIKACKLMENESQIGLVTPRIQDSKYGNLHGMTIDSIKQYWALFGEAFIFRSSLMTEIGYFDETFRTYYIDLDFPLTVLKLGYTTISTKEVGFIHHRIRDEEINSARATTRKIMKNQQEKEYIEKKWNYLQNKIGNYLRHSYLKKYKALFFKRLCSIMYYSQSLRPFVEKNNKFSNKLYDLLLEQIVVFKDKRYDYLKDFYLAQKYPEEIISSLE